MKVTPVNLHVSDSIGNVSGEIIEGEKTEVVLTLAHGAGAGMNHSFMIALAEALAHHHITTLRFNFPFMEKKRGRPDIPAVAHSTIESAISLAHATFPSKPLFVSGKSFGGRMSSQHLANSPEAHVKGIVFFGFPLHPAGKPSVERAEHLKEISMPMLFLQGTRDELAQWDLITSVTDSLSLATLQKLEGADHAFKAGKKNLISDLAQFTKKWISTTI
ncbi:MAG: alpha/beta family hydrolase [Cyclobacteriaceae bacterium]|jgi:predicted alpha/beta-hydrolase family hydrolase|nr:dienelactone hydrolase family protein [Flammeovirgaceae bacterium]